MCPRKRQIRVTCQIRPHPIGEGDGDGELDNGQQYGLYKQYRMAIYDDEMSTVMPDEQTTQPEQELAQQICTCTKLFCTCAKRSMDQSKRTKKRPKI